MGTTVGVPRIERQADSEAVESSLTNTAEAQQKCGAILSEEVCAILGVPEIEHQANIRAVESNRAGEADVQQNGGTISSEEVCVILGTAVGAPKIERGAEENRRQQQRRLIAAQANRRHTMSSWSPPAGVPSLRGESKEEFLRGCDSWFRRDEGQSVTCRVIELSCQGGQSALVRFWCK